ncbi:MAG TPA: hypothetical protein VHL78_03760 [Actinomycetota bacterium]|nr:hypothetical protein [Actinomycetota bacterium]
MSDPGSRFPWRRTEELPAAEPRRATERTTAPPARPRPGRPRPPLAWLVVAVLAALLVFFLGYLAGRSGGASPEEARPASGKARACVRAATLSARVTRLHRQALVNRAEFARALGKGDEVQVAALDSQLRALTARIDQASTKAARVLQRCQR